MKLSDKGLFALMLHEGIVPGPYRDSVGVWTYGVGHTKAAGYPDPATMARGVPANLDAALKDVFALFRRDVAKYEEAVTRAIKVPVAQHEFDAAVSFHYNTGAIGKASWVKALNAGDKTGAIKGIMSWSKPKEIIPRRQAEQTLFANGAYPTGKAVVWGVSTNGGVIWKALRTLSMTEALALMGPLPVPHQPAPPPAAAPQTAKPASPAPAAAPSGVAGAVAALVAAVGLSVAAFFDQIAEWFRTILGG